MQVIIDRFEDGYAVLELPNKSALNVPRELFPGAEEGDIYQITKDDGEKARRLRRMQSKFDRLKRF